MKKARLTALLLALCILLLPSCTGKTADETDIAGKQTEESAPAEKTELLTHIFRGESVPLPEGYSLNDAVTPLYDSEQNTITCFCSSTVEVPDAADPSRTNFVRENHLLTVSSDGTVLKDEVFTLDALENAGIQNGAFTDDSFFCLASTYDPAQDTETFYLVKYALADGSVTVSGSLQPLFAETDQKRPWFSVNYMDVDKDGFIYLNSESEILVLDANFVRSFSVFADNWISGLTASPDGTVYAAGHFDGSQGLCPIDKTAKSFGAKVKGITSLDSLYFGEGFDIYFTDDTGLYGMNFAASDTEESVPELVMHYQNSDVSSVDILTIIDENTFLASERDPETFDTLFTLYEKAPDIDLSTIKVIEIALNGIPYSIPALIVAFNKAHPDCRIVVKDYASEIDDYMQAEEKLAFDVINGTIKPDIVVTHSTADLIGHILDNDLYTDLYPYIDRDDHITRDNLFGAVKNLFDDDGKMWGLTTEFSVKTLIAPDAALGGRTSWTFTEMLDFAKSLPAGTELIPYTTQKSAASALFGSGGYGMFMNEETGEAHFDSPAFISYLEYLASLPADTDSAALPADYRDTLAERRRDGKIMLEARSFGDIFGWMQMQVFFGTQDYTLIGYPANEDGYGSYAIAQDCFIILSDAEYPAEAWEFIKSVTAPAYDENRGGYRTLMNFPILKSMFTPLAESAYKLQYRLKLDGSGGGASTYDPENPRTEADYNYTVIMDFFTEEDAAALLDFLDTKVGTDRTQTVSEEITAIVNEEIDSFLAGMRDTSAATAMIQSRVNLWLAEHE